MDIADLPDIEDVNLEEQGTEVGEQKVQTQTPTLALGSESKVAPVVEEIKEEAPRIPSSSKEKDLNRLLAPIPEPLLPYEAGTGELLNSVFDFTEDASSIPKTNPEAHFNNPVKEYVPPRGVRITPSRTLPVKVAPSRVPAAAKTPATTATAKIPATPSKIVKTTVVKVKPRIGSVTKSDASKDSSGLQELKTVGDELIITPQLVRTATVLTLPNIQTEVVKKKPRTIKSSAIVESIASGKSSDIDVSQLVEGRGGYTVQQLKDIIKELNKKGAKLSLVGVKADLVDRIKDYLGV